MCTCWCFVSAGRRTGFIERALTVVTPGRSCRVRRQNHRFTGQHAAASRFSQSPASSAATTPGRRPTWHRRHSAVDVVRAGSAHHQGTASGPASNTGTGAVHGSLWTLCNGSELSLQRVPGSRHRHLVSYLSSLPLHRAFDRQLAVYVRAAVGGWRSQRHLPQHNDRSMAQVCRRRYGQ